MQKTVKVVDEAGNRYEATYTKRAKGLVKCGRARFIDENTICLACPPNTQNEFSEDTYMSTNTEKEVRTEEATANVPAASKYTLEYALDMIERIATNTYEITHALDVLSQMESEMTPTGGSADQMAKATADVIRCRETTNQKLIEFYSGMVNDLKPVNEAKCSLEAKSELMGLLTTVISSQNGATALDDIRQILKENKF